MKRLLILVLVVLVALGVGLPVFNTWSHAVARAKFLKIRDMNPAMTINQVETLLGRPASIEQSQTADQALSGEVYQYHIASGAMKIVFVNGVVFDADFVSAN